MGQTRTKQEMIQLQNSDKNLDLTVENELAKISVVYVCHSKRTDENLTKYCNLY
jgi:hypothetical protein